MDYKTTLDTLIARQDLDQAHMREVMDAVMDGQLTQAQIGALLVALRMKGETTAEIAGAASSMRDHATHIDAGPAPIVDTCGTGGDGAHTYNISTTAAFIAAGAGAKIAKHGNRSVSSACGSADVLGTLGVNVSASPETVGRCVREVGIGFLFAPSLHGAMKHAIGPRRELGVRTLFNLLGPLTNPARATAQVIGVFDPRYTTVFAEVLRDMGSQRAMIVHGDDGLDEITGTACTRISELRDGQVRDLQFDPRPLIGDFCTAADLRGGDAEANAAILRDILAGSTGPMADVACLNAAAAITVAGLADDMPTAFALARQSIVSGAAAAKLAALITASA